ncbi:MAG: alpha/beta hydrolase [Silicimonas sp.]|nr:alpha/beta hydrolase [Silicimonas sp.]
MTPLVMVHGFLGGSDQWNLQEPLAKERPVLRVDLPGFGKNAHMAPIDRIEGFAEWVLSEVATQDIGRFDLLGHSMGGMIVQDMVRIAPDRVRRLVLYGTGAVGELPGRFEPISTSIERVTAEGAQSTARRIAATWFRGYEESAEYPGCARIAEMATLPAMVAGLRAMQHWSGEVALANIPLRTLVVWGDLDRSYAWPQIEQLWRSIPTCNLAVVPNCAHAVHSEQPELFNTLINSFLTLKT